MNIPSTASTLVRAPTGAKVNDAPAALTKYETPGLWLTTEPIPAIFDGLKSSNFILKTLHLLLYWSSRGINLPWEFLMRRKIGERYVNVYVLAAFIGVLVLIKLHPSKEIETRILPYVLAAIVGFRMALNSVLREFAEKRGDYWHSYSEGESIFRTEQSQQFWQQCFGPITTKDVAKNFREPFWILCLALIASVVYFTKFVAWGNGDPVWADVWDAPIVHYLLVSALSMFFYQHYSAQKRRDALLDRLDAEVIVLAEEATENLSPSAGLQMARGVAVLPFLKPRKWGKHAPKHPRNSSGNQPVGVVPEKPRTPAVNTPEPSIKSTSVSSAYEAEAAVKAATAPAHASHSFQPKGRVQQLSNVADRALFMAALDAARPPTKAASTPPGTPAIVLALNPKPAIDEEEFTFRNENGPTPTQSEPAAQSSAAPAPQPAQVPVAAGEAPSIMASVAETKVEAPAIEPPAAPPPERRKRRTRLKSHFPEFEEQPPVSAPEVSANQPAGGAWEPDLAGWGQRHPAANRELINLGGEVPERQPAQPTEGAFLTRKRRSRGRLHR